MCPFKQVEALETQWLGGGELTTRWMQIHQTAVSTQGGGIVAGTHSNYAETMQG